MTQRFHFTREESLAYVSEKLSVQERQSYEDHVYGCDQCLLIHMDCLNLTQSQLSTDLTTNVMNIIQSPKESHKKSRIPLFRRPIFQYVTAASITLILMSTGIFQDAALHIDQLKLESTENVESSYTNQLMNKAVVMLDAIEQFKFEPKGGAPHE